MPFKFLNVNARKHLLQRREEEATNHKDNDDTVGKDIVSVRQEEILRTIQEPNKVSG